MAPHRAVISVGSNMGDKMRFCRDGIAALTAEAAMGEVRVSSFYRTEPVDYTDQDWFVNAAVQIDTDLSASQLLEVLQSIQRRAGRKTDTIRFGPRRLDLDIIFFDDLILNTPQLVIPHPRMHKRRFVLQPICDINPAIEHPQLRQTVGELLAQLKPDDQRIVLLDA